VSYKKQARIRAAALETLNTIFSMVNQELYAKHVELLAKNVFSLVDDKERNVQMSLW
jgi:hypothetical protein